MSIHVMTAVWSGFPGGGSELLTLLALADWSDDDGRCWPSVSAISKKTRLSHSQTQRVVHSLIKSGYVVVTGNVAGGAPGATRRYKINLDLLTGRIDATGSTDATPTGGAGATGRMDATGSADTRDGLHGCAETGRTHATQTVIEPSVTVTLLPTGKPVRPVQADCPYQEIINLYHVAMPLNPRCKVLNNARRGAIKQRWAEASSLTCKPFGYETTATGLVAWKVFFETCADSLFLTGRTVPQPGKPPFFADIDFIMSPGGFAKILENKYHREVA